jgi:hypothetical protein
MKAITIHQKKKNFLSIISVIVFLLIAAGSAKVNKLHCGSFSYQSTGEDKEGFKEYLLLNDDTKIYGQKISWKSGLLVKDQIRIDDNKYPIHDVRGYFSNGTYYTRHGNEYMQRIVHGKLNVYYYETTVTTTSTDMNGHMRTTTRPYCTHYVQVGDNGALTAIANQSDIKKFVKDCPKAMAMIDKKDKEIRRAIRKDRFYLNQIFVTYNNDCE